MQEPHNSVVGAHRRTKGLKPRNYNEINYIATGNHGFSARSIARRSLERPGFLSDCKRVLFGKDEVTAHIDDMMFAREN